MRGFFSERREKDAFGIDLMEHDKIDGSPQNHTGFACAGSCGEKEGSVYMANGLLLLFVRDEVLKFPVIFEVQSKFRFIALKIENYPDMYCQKCLIPGKFRIYDLYAALWCGFNSGTRSRFRSVVASLSKRKSLQNLYVYQTLFKKMAKDAF